MKRWMLLLLTLTVLAGGALYSLASPVLKAAPSRFVARLPEPIQALGVREHVDILPTAAREVNAEVLLLNSVPEATATAPTLPTARATVTSVVTGSQSSVQAEVAAEVPTAEPSPTPVVTLPPLPSAARLDNIRHRFQDWNNCGPATLAMALSYFGLGLTQAETATVLKPNPEDRNVSPQEMVNYVQEQTTLAALTRSNGSLETIRRLLANGNPVIVEVGIDPPGEYAWMGWYGHYLLLVAYDDSQEQFWVYDSWFGTSAVPGENATAEGRMIGYEELDQYWQQFNRNYIAIFEEADTEIVAEIIGQDMRDSAMWSHALESVEQELRADTANAFLWFNLGTVYNALGDYKNAALAFDQAREIGLPWRMLWYQFGPFEAYYQLERYEDVILLADVTLQDRPYFEESYYYKGLAHAALGQVQKARTNLEKAVAFNPGFSPAAIALAELN